MVYAAGCFATVGAALMAAMISFRAGLRVRIAASCAVIALSLYLLVFQLLKLYALRDYADFAIWNEIVYNVGRGKGAWSSLQDGILPGTGRWFAAHFTPLIYVFALSAAGGSLPVNLLVLQFLALSTAIAAVYWYAKWVLNEPAPALAVAALLVLYPPYQYIALDEFEMLRFCIPLLIFTFLALECGRLWWYWPLLALSLLVREEVAITAALMGLYTLLFMRQRRMTGAVTALLSLAYFLIVFELLIPSFRTAGADNYIAAFWLGSLGRTIPEVLFNLVAHPLLVLRAIMQPLKLANLFMYLLPLSLVPLLGGAVLLVAAGNVGLNLLSQSVEHTSYFLYYLSPTMPFVFIALVKGVKRLGSWIDRCAPSGPHAADGVSVAVFALFAGALVANLFFGPSPLSLQFWFRNYQIAPFRTLDFYRAVYYVSPRDRELKSVVSVVPTDASVAAEQHLLPALYDRRSLKVFPDISGTGWVVIDKRRKEKTGLAKIQGSYDGLRGHPQYYYDWVEKDPRWRLVISRDGYFVYHRLPVLGSVDGKR
jgi:uncharacterized membrane protein